MSVGGVSHDWGSVERVKGIVSDLGQGLFYLSKLDGRCLIKGTIVERLCLIIPAPFSTSIFQVGRLLQLTALTGLNVCFGCLLWLGIRVARVINQFGQMLEVLRFSLIVDIERFCRCAYQRMGLFCKRGALTITGNPLTGGRTMRSEKTG